ncbi:ABC transporter permease [Paenibacillus donghaensis]|uniref:ABC3 transporter permease C-terminal domain-containing protein n=1 Tax=Paenibacillus donghaensis TaxID=414771 RepID=A0A2Z2KE98_9BACL|nr:FtsX-like permease family protein [Paenibacillus donghaensis]ASA21440.1 hypothetical protein B9T62_12020 [Paenibacillus donghaensis]
MRGLNKQIYSQLRQSRSYAIVLFLIVLLTSLMFFFVQFSIDKNEVKLKGYNLAQKQEQFRFQLSDTPEAELKLEELKQQFVIEERRIKKVTEQGRNLFLMQTPQELNLPYLVEGQLPQRTGEIAVLPQFLELNHKRVGDKLYIGREGYTITGSMYLPDVQAFVPWGEMQQEYASATFVLMQPEDYQAVTAYKRNYYSARAKSGVEAAVSLQKLKDDPEFINFEQSEDTAANSELRHSLESNTSLALSFLVVLSMVTWFIFHMFYKRFLLLHQQEIGVYKALGYTRRQISSVMLRFAVILSAAGALGGLLAGFLASNVLMNMLRSSYSFPYYERGVSAASLALGLLLPVAGTILITLATIVPFMKREPASLLNPVQSNRDNRGVLAALNKLVSLLPEKLRLPFRVVLRRWNALLLSAAAVLLMTTLFIMSYALYQSSNTLIDSQTAGVNYSYDISYSSLQPDALEASAAGRMYYLRQPVELFTESSSTSKPLQMLGLDTDGDLFILLDDKKHPIELENMEGVVVPQAMHVLYGIDAGDQLQFKVSDSTFTASVEAISENGEPDTVYTARPRLVEWLNLPANVHSGLWSKLNTADVQAQVVTSADRQAALQSSAVSNRSSAVMNQVIGLVIGCLLIYLVILLNFQDSLRDMQVLKLLGYRPKEIGRFLLDVYKPLFVVFYLLSLLPAIYITKQILRLISLQTGDYIPFSTSPWMLVLPLVVILLEYTVVVISFQRRVRKASDQESLNVI